MVVVGFVFNVPPTAKVICYGLKSHPTDWRPGAPGYKLSGYALHHGDSYMHLPLQIYK